MFLYSKIDTMIFYKSDEIILITMDEYDMNLFYYRNGLGSDKFRDLEFIGFL